MTNAEIVLEVITRLAPDKIAPICLQSNLEDDLGFDSPRRLELVATLEETFHKRLREPANQLDTVSDVITWIENFSTNA